MMAASVDHYVYILRKSIYNAQLKKIQNINFNSQNPHTEYTEFLATLTSYTNNSVHEVCTKMSKTSTRLS